VNWVLSDEIVSVSLLQPWRTDYHTSAKWLHWSSMEGGEAFTGLACKIPASFLDTKSMLSIELFEDVDDDAPRTIREH